MDTDDTPRFAVDSPESEGRIGCTACESALRSPGRERISFLLVEQFRIPVLGCADHLEQFASLCGLATEDGAELLGHRPAGGLPCPGCRHAAYDAEHPVVQVGNGGLALLACPAHQSDVVGKYRAGLRVRNQLDASLDAVSTDP